MIEWELRWGDDLEYLEEIEADTGETPEPLRDRPELPTHLRPVHEAFWILSAGRPPGFEIPGPIPTADIEAACRIFGFEDDRRFLRVIRTLDALFLKAAAKQAEARSKKPAKR